MAKVGKDFEVAVGQFVRTLTDSAIVNFDHRVPDRHTGKPRQVDVWVTGTFGGHIPFSMLISCKDHKRPLDVPEVESAAAERASTGASMVVLYSSSGFGETALAKADALG